MAEVGDPLKEQLSSGERSLTDAYPIMHLDLTLLLAVEVAGAAQPGGAGSVATKDEVEKLTWLCYQFGEPGWKCFRPFDWLATYLRRHRGVPVSAATLFQAAWTADRTGRFRIPAVE
jgi:hypothetical protein